MQYATQNQIDEVLTVARKRRDEILNTASEYPENRPTYYVDAISGNDCNDGKSPETAWKSLERVASADLNEGDVVLFKRGCIFRGCMASPDGITYSAYGEGEKPKFYGSIDAANPDLWSPTCVPNVWLFRPMIPYVKEVGSVVINDGKLWGIKICTNKKTNERCDMQRGTDSPMGILDVYNGRSYVHRERTVFGGLCDIKGDLEFYHNYCGNDDMIDDHLYLNCPDGNPGEVFESIEISLRYSIFGRGKNLTYDNLCFKYAGIHGISHRGYDIIVRNCEFGWIGGSGMFPEHYLMGIPSPYGDDTTRLGNGVEVYGECNNYVIENCYFEQIYDTAVTAQVAIGPAEGRMREMRNIRWCNNVFNMCYNSWELWLSINGNNEDLGELENIDVSGNITVNGGFGWSHQRPDPCYSDWLMWSGNNALCKFKNCSVHDNIFLNSKKNIVYSSAIGPEKVTFKNNKIIHAGVLGFMPEDLNYRTTKMKTFEATDENLALLEEKQVWENTEFYKLTEEQSGINGFNPPIKL